MRNKRKFIDDIEYAARELHPKFIALAGSPIPFMNGTDFPAIARVIETETGIPAFSVPTNGMNDYVYGAGIALEEIAKRFVRETDRQENRDPSSRTVNLLGVTPLDFGPQKNVETLKENLQKYGWQVMSVWAMGDDLKTLQRSAEADVNLVVSAVGLRVAKILWEKYKIPYVIGTPNEWLAEDISNALERAATRQAEPAVVYLQNRMQQEADITLVGEPVTMGSLAAGIEKRYGRAARVLCPLKECADLLGEKDKMVLGEEAMEEASRCINCKNAQCVKGCPVAIQIPQFIEQVKNGNIEEAYRIISESSALPAVCGRVCPQESQCESKCVRAIKGEAVAIGRLERFVADWYMANCDEMPEKPAQNGKKVAVIGSGPSGLTCAGDLAKMGYDVTIFEALHQPGGVLVYGIPEFRLPKDKVVKEEVENVKSLGVKIETNVIIGKSTTVDELMENEGFEAVFIGSGAGLPMFMGIPGEVSNGVFSANEYLTRSNLMKAFREDYDTPIVTGKKVVVVGGGNVAMDAARTALRLGAEVHVVYRRSEEELPARKEEVHHAKEEGIIFDLLTNPVEILADENGWVKGIKCVRMELGEPDASGRRRPVVVEGSEFEMDVDTVIMSLGTSPNPLISSTTIGLDVNRRKCIIADEESGQTSKEGVYAGGDAVTGAATVILAMGAGKAAAKGIDEFIKNKAK